MALQERHPLEEARPDVAGFEGFDLAFGKMEKRVDRGFGKDLGQGFQDLLSAPPAGQPVVDQGDLEVFHPQGLYGGGSGKVNLEGVPARGRTPERNPAGAARYVREA